MLDTSSGLILDSRLVTAASVAARPPMVVSVPEHIGLAGPRATTYPFDVSVCNTLCGVDARFGLDALDEDDPFEIDDQASHLFKHAPFGTDDVYEVWRSDPLFYPAMPPADWLMVVEIDGRVLVVPLAPPDSGDPSRCRPIGCYLAAAHLADRYREDR